MHNFSVNLPSIPSTSIRYKIRNSKAKGFNCKQIRFKQNMHYLVTHFLTSFPNLSPAKIKEMEKSMENLSSASTNVSKSFKKESNNFRWFVGENKKNLFLQYQQQNKECQNPEIRNDSKYNRGYSFAKNYPKDALDSVLMKQPSSVLEKHLAKITDNYYFKQTEESVDEKDGTEEGDKVDLERRRREENIVSKGRRVRKSAVFQSEDRWRCLEREIKGRIVPGPGQYLTEAHAQPERRHKVESKRKDKKNNIINVSKIMQILDTPSPSKPNPNPYLQPIGQVSHAKRSGLVFDKIPEHKSSMFAQGNIDRFGSQIYPIQVKPNIPGPGAYKGKESIEDQANRILVLEQQRRLLRQWYND